MAENSAISWTDNTFNGWIGCTKVGPGCDACYAEAQDSRKRWEGRTHWGAGVIVCAWGQHGTLHGRGEIVRLMLRDAGLKLNMLRATKSGHPGHPLYVLGATQPVPFGTAA